MLLTPDIAGNRSRCSLLGRFIAVWCRELQVGSGEFSRIWLVPSIGVWGEDLLVVATEKPSLWGDWNSWWNAPFLNFQNFGAMLCRGNCDLCSDRMSSCGVVLSTEIWRCAGVGGIETKSLSNELVCFVGDSEKLPSDPSSDAQSMISQFSSGIEGISDTGVEGRGYATSFIFLIFCDCK